MKYTFGLCSARHELPVTDYIYPSELNPTDFDTMRKIAMERIPDDADELIVYVTGLTAAMLSVADVCEARKINLAAMHFDRDTGEYVPQVVLTFMKCAFCGHRHQNEGWYCPHCGST